MIRRILNRIGKKLSPDKTNTNIKLNEYSSLENKSLVEQYAALRHEAHRIEKAEYNNLLKNKKSIYDEKVNKVKGIQTLILKNDPNAEDNPVFRWSQQITSHYPDIATFIANNSRASKKLNIENGKRFKQDLINRRSCRVFEKNLDQKTAKTIFQELIEVAKWAPNSGNRQAVRLKLITETEEKELLIGIKEKHCYTAPLLIYIGIDSRLYGALSTTEECMYLDASAAITQIILYIDKIGLGASWNHFGLDMINSRNQNIAAYNNFIKKLNIPEYIIPIAIIAIGKPKIITPTPERMPNSYFVI